MPSLSCRGGHGHCGNGHGWTLDFHQGSGQSRNFRQCNSYVDSNNSSTYTRHMRKSRSGSQGFGSRVKICTPLLLPTRILLLLLNQLLLLLDNNPSSSTPPLQSTPPKAGSPLSSNIGIGAARQFFSFRIRMVWS